MGAIKLQPSTSYIYATAFSAVLNSLQVEQVKKEKG